MTYHARMDIRSVLGEVDLGDIPVRAVMAAVLGDGGDHKLVEVRAWGGVALLLLAQPLASNPSLHRHTGQQEGRHEMRPWRKPVKYFSWHGPRQRLGSKSHTPQTQLSPFLLVGNCVAPLFIAHAVPCSCWPPLRSPLAPAGASGPPAAPSQSSQTSRESWSASERREE